MARVVLTCCGDGGLALWLGECIKYHILYEQVVFGKKNGYCIHTTHTHDFPDTNVLFGLGQGGSGQPSLSRRNSAGTPVLAPAPRGAPT